MDASNTIIKWQSFSLKPASDGIQRPPPGQRCTQCTLLGPHSALSTGSMTWSSRPPCAPCTYRRDTHGHTNQGSQTMQMLCLHRANRRPGGCSTDKASHACRHAASSKRRQDCGGCARMSGERKSCTELLAVLTPSPPNVELVPLPGSWIFPLSQPKSTLQRECSWYQRGARAGKRPRPAPGAGAPQPDAAAAAGCARAD